MKSLGRTLVTAGAAAVLCIGFPLSAQAAEGLFFYTSEYGPIVLENPADGLCYSVGSARDPQNSTDRVAIVYSEKRCAGHATRIKPGGEDFLAFASVQFSR
ncbi:hypothetical protein [Streptomyces sp. 35G-GA-8]|uniref:hypothetical protein n=1 Tax=Streptomyces sp. 35G-GA-8 TaxID=2939434 RepID=UPI00201E8EE7|nr:hypothetical protein [Streptomyces sp. 35G-GA-8]MCL7375706.1 hypothetical protein [Streptomyces sp. 35G-GA-8]